MKEFFRVLYTFIYYFIQCVYKHCTHIFTSIYQKLLLVFHIIWGLSIDIMIYILY